MFSIAKCKNFVTRVWGSQIFLVLLLFNLLSNFAAIVLYKDILTIIAIVGISALAATVESCICRLFKGSKLRKCVFWCLVALHLLIAIVDYFLVVNFQTVLTVDVMCIMAETTWIETISFFETYLDITSLLAFIVASFLVIWLFVRISRWLAGKWILALIAMLLTVLGASAYASVVSGIESESDGIKSIAQLHSFTRVGRAAMKFKSEMEMMNQFRDANLRVEATLQDDEAPSIILVLGESFSVYHSSLYGYSKDTNPLLGAREKDGSLCVFDDVVSVSDHTGIVMGSVFVANGADIPSNDKVLFPTFFKRTGYKTALLDNQYFVNNGFTWITDDDLSQIMFDYRNEENVGYDINLIKELPDFADPQMVVIHLYGQHYTYSRRYPAEFKRFKASDYSPTLPEEEREVIAHYDNATLYNDFVVDSIINKFKDKNCIVVYFSDHGEELYEIDDFVGHGNALQRPTIKYQIRVPMMVWTSPKFESGYPDVVKRIHESVHKPILTDNIPHFLFEVAGIDTKYYCPELSFINDKYNESKPRMIFGNLDYDKQIKLEQKIKPRY